MRIISGSHRGKHLYPPPGLPVRPTTDIAKESLFNILWTFLDIETLTVLDLFSGTGNISFEFASRGSKLIVAVDNNERCTNYIRKITSELNFKNLSVIRSDVFGYLSKSRQAFDLVFADPPYDLEKISDIPAAVFQHVLKPGAWLVVEHSGTTDFSRTNGYYTTRNYGKVHFTFFQKPEESPND